jgi:hypothetical protein
LDIVEHFSAAPAIAADDVAMTAATQIIEVLLGHHAAVADEDHAPEPEALLQITHHIRYRLGTAPVALKHRMRDRPPSTMTKPTSTCGLRGLSSRLWPWAPFSGGACPSK